MDPRPPNSDTGIAARVRAVALRTCLSRRLSPAK
jgi:hypothetical protein